MAPIKTVTIEYGRVVNLLDWEARRLSNELQALAADVARIDTCYVNCKETIDPDRNRWELCSRVLARKDVVEKLSESW